MLKVLLFYKSKLINSHNKDVRYLKDDIAVNKYYICIYKI